MLPAGTGVSFRARHGCKKEGASADKESSAEFQSFLRVKSQGVKNGAREGIEAAVLEMFKLARAEPGGITFLAAAPAWPWLGCTGWPSPWEVKGRL